VVKYIIKFPNSDVALAVWQLLRGPVSPRLVAHLQKKGLQDIENEDDDEDEDEANHTLPKVDKSQQTQMLTNEFNKCCNNLLQKFEVFFCGDRFFKPHDCPEYTSGVDAANFRNMLLCNAGRIMTETGLLWSQYFRHWCAQDGSLITIPFLESHITLETHRPPRPRG